MRPAAKVSSIDAIRQFKAALADFVDKARLALMEAKGDVQRTMSRLQTEQLSHWQREVRTWTNKVAQAKVDLARAQMQSGDRRPIIEKKALDAAVKRLEEAEHKIQRIRHWSRAMEREAMLFRGQLQQLDRTLDADLPRAMAQIDRLLDSLDAYMRIKPTAAAPALDAANSLGTSASRSPDETAQPMRADEPEDNDDPARTQQP